MDRVFQRPRFHALSRPEIISTRWIFKRRVSYRNRKKCLFKDKGNRGKGPGALSDAKHDWKCREARLIELSARARKLGANFPRTKRQPYYFSYFLARLMHSCANCERVNFTESRNKAHASLLLPFFHSKVGNWGGLWWTSFSAQKNASLVAKLANPTNQRNVFFRPVFDESKRDWSKWV